MNKRILRAIGWMLTLVLLAAALLVPAPAQVNAASDIDIQDGVTLHCWNWSFKNIEANMSKIASLGYTAIQTSPIQQAKQSTTGYPTNDWWVYYQPMGFHIDNSGSSALGTKAEFKSMCATAHKYGIKVIVDVVANHMGNGNSGSGISPAVIADLKNDSTCWHDITKNTNDYSKRYDVTQYCMAGLPDLNTANKKVQNYVLNYLKECVDAGADGFRFDAVKHIETPDDGTFSSDFWPTVINGIKAYDSDVYCYGELLDQPGGSLGVGSYTKYMSITDNTWSDTVRNSVVGGKNAGAFSYAYHKNTAASNLVLWAESHDTFADGKSSGTSVQSINKTWALVAARSDAMGLYLARPANMSQTLGTASATGWSFAEVSAVNHFHNTFIGQKEYVSNQNGIAYVERGTSGVVLVNCKGTSASVSVAAHTMKDGTYTDQITGNTFKVSGGKITGSIGNTGIAVVYNANPCDHPSHGNDGFCKECGVNVGHSYDASGKCACGAIKIADRTIYFTNSGNWTTVNFYSWYTPESIISNTWPGNAMTKVEGKIFSCTVPADAPNIIFNNGSAQTDDLIVPSVSSGKNMYDYATGKWSTYEPAGGPKPVACAHPSHSIDGICAACGMVVKHNMVNDICTICGYTDQPTATEPDQTPTEPGQDATEPGQGTTEPSTPPETQPDNVPTTPSETVPEQTQQPTTGNDSSSTDTPKDNSLGIWILVIAAALAAGAATLLVIRKRKN